ncbi:uncharacterized protein LOC130443413 [Diorhabda sublineata]|uniref:uncharacterized protein LOC130443413 n=1 Tax=Diorhabda sublineata TaxID=1163346 RepID=UPI0024E0D940|nr:uncharacterized protein LOC130443413 [Diorhabda sublineata]
MNVFSCSECRKEYTLLINLRRHAKTSHPDKVDTIAPHKTYKYECEPCKKKFNHLRDFKCHKNKHQLSSQLKTVSKYNCSLCNFKGSKVNLINHFDSIHNIIIKTNTFEFNSFENFIVWKSEVEKNTKSQFVKERGTVSFKNKTIIKFNCHRSGYYVAKGKGLRRLKRKGSNKINGFCPASMVVHMVENGKCKVSFIDKHVGHENEEIGYRAPTYKKRKTKNETKKSIHKIRYDSDFIKEKAYEPPVDNDLEYSLAVAKGKEFIISHIIPHLYKVAEGIICIEQADEFKKLCAPIASTLAEIGNRYTEIKKQEHYS